MQRVLDSVDRRPRFPTLGAWVSVVLQLLLVWIWIWIRIWSLHEIISLVRQIEALHENKKEDAVAKGTQRGATATTLRLLSTTRSSNRDHGAYCCVLL